MPVSEARFVSLNQNGYVPATIASAVSGTVTNTKTAAGQYGVALGNSATVVLAFHLFQAGVTPNEAYQPWVQYNIPTLFPTNLNEIAIYYEVAGAALTSCTVGIFATGSSGGGGTDTVTLLAQANNGMATAEGYQVFSIALENLPDAPPNPVIYVELDIDTGADGTAIVYGVYFR